MSLNPFDLIGNFINAGASIAGANIQAQTNKQIAADNIAYQKEFNQQQLAWGREQAQNQKQYAQEGIQWKVADAVKAGLHPLAAMGANTTSYSPVTLGGEAPQNNYSSTMGQDLSRAAKALFQQHEREEIDNQLARRQQLEKGSLENEVLRQEVRSRDIRNSQLSGQVPVPMPRPGPDRTVSGWAVKDDDIKSKEEDYPATKIVRPFGYPLYANPWFNDGQQFEDRYGDSEVGSTIKFGVNTLADHVYSAYRRMPGFDMWDGSGSRVKRFRRGGYTAPSYRPWAE